VDYGIGTLSRVGSARVPCRSGMGWVCMHARDASCLPACVSPHADGASHQATGASLALRSARTQMTHHDYAHAYQHHTTPPHIPQHLPLPRSNAVRPCPPNPHRTRILPSPFRHLLASSHSPHCLFRLDPARPRRDARNDHESPTPRALGHCHSFAFVSEKRGKLESRRVIVLAVVTLVRSITPS
jgi:hypothetical protein